MKENLVMENAGFPAKLRAKIDELWLRSVRLYTYNTPLARGRDRISAAALKMCRYLPESITAPTKDGRMLSADLTTGMHTTLFFVGDYEPAITRIVRSLLPECGVFLDVGANFGWYTTLFRKYAGTSGAVHSFEPVPSTFVSLRKNFELMGNPENVVINNLALGDHEGEITINLFEGLPNGHASASTQGRDDAISHQCRLTTLDTYLDEHGVGDVDFVKVDIEGSELNFLKGAERLFQQTVPPIWLMEMSLILARNFGYLHNDLIEFMSSRADYDFYRIDEIKAKLIAIDSFAPDDLGANVICVPRNHAVSKTSLKQWL